MRTAKYYFDTEKRGVLTVYHQIGESERFVELNDEQREYFLNHRTASYDEIWYCGNIPRPERTLEQAIQKKLFEIELYDTSENVNQFYYNDIPMWLDKATRVGLVNSLNSAELTGVDNINIWYNGISINLPINNARYLLAQLEMYAVACYNVTEQHKSVVREFDTIEEVDVYDITADYPEKPHFNN